MILALDTSTGISVAVLSPQGELLAARSSAQERSHAEQLAVLIAESLQEAGVSRAELTAVAVGTGPAPYTGLRVGLVTATTLGFGLDIPVWGVSSLDALAESAPADVTDLVVVTDAKRKEVYTARYRRIAGEWQRISGPDVAKPAALARGESIVVGTDVYPELSAQAARVDAAALGRLALRRAKAGLAQPTTPLYLRRPDATPPPAPKPPQ